MDVKIFTSQIDDKLTVVLKHSIQSNAFKRAPKKIACNLSPSRMSTLCWHQRCIFGFNVYKESNQSLRVPNVTLNKSICRIK